MNKTTEQREKAKQRGLWQRRHRLNVVERETLVELNRKYGTYLGPKAKAERSAS